MKLTRRQLVVLERVADGETDAEIAAALKIKQSTAKAHAANVRDRLLVLHPELGKGSIRPRMVILRYFRFVKSEVKT